MKLHRKSAISLLCLVAYTVLSIIQWYTTEKATNIIFVMVVWFVIAIAYIYARILKKKTTLSETDTKLKSKSKIKQEESEKESDAFVGFRELFSQENQTGGGKYE